jgi:hypothetical protein
MFGKTVIEESKYLIAPKNWTPEQANPFSDKGDYEHYSVLFLASEEDGKFSYDRIGSGAFVFTLHRFVENMDQRIFDFIEYENLFGRRVLLGTNYDLDIKKYIKRLHCETQRYKVRKSDPAVLVHSTTTHSWQSIMQDMTLKSVRMLTEADITYESVGFHADQEPEEYKDFVMFGGLGAMPEFMFQAQQYGRIVSGVNEIYDPGIRLYLDGHKMIQDKIIYRDGIHQIKVKGSLELRDYLLFNYTVEDNSSAKKWTPKTFADECDKWFHRYTQGKFAE